MNKLKDYKLSFKLTESKDTGLSKAIEDVIKKDKLKKQRENSTKN